MSIPIDTTIYLSSGIAILNNLLIARERRRSLISMFTDRGQGRSLELTVARRRRESVRVTVRITVRNMRTAHDLICPADSWLVHQSESRSNQDGCPSPKAD